MQEIAKAGGFLGHGWVWEEGVSIPVFRNLEDLPGREATSVVSWGWWL